VLHALRDRLLPDEAVDLSAELPMLVRGFYFEGWQPSLHTDRERTLDEFIAHVRRELHNARFSIDAEAACRAVFTLLSRRISAGEIRDVRAELPAVLQPLWPRSPAPGEHRPDGYGRTGAGRTGARGVSDH
jgi:uncharacterized protein (DUF2267 family)